MWIYAKAVVCNGKNHMQNYTIFKFRSIMEAINWVCDDALDEHVWVSERTIPSQEVTVLEALQHDLVILCIVQWWMLWFSSPTSINNDLLNDGEILGNFYEAVNLAFQSVLGAPYFGMNSPRIFFLKAMRKVLEDMPEIIWSFEREMVGWEPAERRDLLLDCGDSGDEVGLAINFKSKYESISVVVPFHSPLRSRSRVKRKLTILKKAMTKNKFWMVVERMANEIRMESYSCVGWRPKLAGSVDTTTTLRGKWKEVSNVVRDLWSLVKDKRSTWQKRCKESLKRE